MPNLKYSNGLPTNAVLLGSASISEPKYSNGLPANVVVPDECRTRAARYSSGSPAGVVARGNNAKPAHVCYTAAQQAAMSPAEQCARGLMTETQYLRAMRPALPTLS